MGYEIVEFQPNTRARRFGNTYSIRRRWPSGGYLRNAVGARRAWSSLEAARAVLCTLTCDDMGITPPPVRPVRTW